MPSRRILKDQKISDRSLIMHPGIKDEDDTIAPVLHFGKHKGKSIDNVACDDPGYIRFIADDCFQACTSQMRQVKQWAVAWMHAQPPPTLQGNLTRRTSAIASHPAMRQAALDESHADVYAFSTKTLSLSQQLNATLRQLKRIDASSFGCFFDYLCRRLLAVHFGLTIEDMRAESMLMQLIPLRDDDGTVMRGINGRVLCDEPDCSAYNRYINPGIATCDILDAVCEVSWCHNQSFGDFDMERGESLKNEVHRLAGYIDELEHALLQTIGLPNEAHVRLNPVLGARGIPADADMIVHDVIWDFKTSVSNAGTSDLLQLLGYAALASTRGIVINSIAIINPITNQVAQCDVSTWKPEDRETYLCHLGATPATPEARLVKVPALTKEPAIHKPRKTSCCARTASGTKCKLAVKSGSFCHVHTTLQFAPPCVEIVA
jgi:hypothetical protein